MYTPYSKSNTSKEMTLTILLVDKLLFMTNFLKVYGVSKLNYLILCGLIYQCKRYMIVRNKN